MNMMHWVLLALVCLPVVEIYLLMQMIGVLGFFITLALLLTAAMVGTHLLRLQGWSAGMRLQQALARGEMPALEILESGLIATGGLLLLLPGFLSDILALLCLIPATRRLLMAWLLRRQPFPGYTGGAPAGDRRTLEGEFKREE